MRMCVPSGAHRGRHRIHDAHARHQSSVSPATSPKSAVSRRSRGGACAGRTGRGECGGSVRATSVRLKDVSKNSTNLHLGEKANPETRYKRTNGAPGASTRPWLGAPARAGSSCFAAYVARGRPTRLVSLHSQSTAPGGVGARTTRAPRNFETTPTGPQKISVLSLAPWSSWLAQAHLPPSLERQRPGGLAVGPSADRISAHRVPRCDLSLTHHRASASPPSLSSVWPPRVARTCLSVSPASVRSRTAFSPLSPFGMRAA